jgi:signal transduction histidine kinase
MDSAGTNNENRPSHLWTGLISTVIPARRLQWIDALVLVTGYVALDWISFFHPLHGLNITPWAPAPALGLVFILRFGWVSALLIAFAVFVGDTWIRDLPVVPSAALALSLAAGYAAIGEALRRRLRNEELFSSRRGFFAWSLIVIVGTLANSAAFIASLSAFDLVPRAGFLAAFARHWIGDSVGILLTMPMLWMLAGERGRAILRLLLSTGETMALLAASTAALWVSFTFGAQSDFKYFYVLFLPIVWAAARQGLSGAILIATVIQAGIIFMVHLLGFSAISVLEVQMLTVVLAMLGFFVGVVIDEQRRISTELRQTLRLAAAGEMAGALAHELNQPLTALSAYAAACDKLLEQGGAQDRVRDAMRQIVAASERAGEVVARLRDFFRTGSTRLELVALDELLDGSVGSFAQSAAQAGVRLTLVPVPTCLLLADRLQLEVVVRNLLSNAFDAVAQRPAAERRIRVSAAMEGVGRVCVEVEDSGPGLSAATAARLFEPFESQKSSGLGLGLVISRAIVDAHGGSLWAEVGDHGVFKMLLPVEAKESHGKQ